jgi:hypothetical protein
MANRHFPVRPDLDQLRHQAKDLLHAVRRSDPDAIVNFREHHPKSIDPATVRLAVWPSQLDPPRHCVPHDWRYLAR